ncbi:hypothetical protein MMC31_007204 [Peltigera leucophlebia]|nr:hypothetical protein [Peltigera leucophlebia]
MMVSSRPGTPDPSKPPSISAPLSKNSTSGANDHLMDTRASNLWEHSRLHSKIWEEPKGESKLLEFITRLGEQSAIPLIRASKEYGDFVTSCSKGASNKSQFHALAARAAAIPLIRASKEYGDFVTSCSKGASNKSQFHALAARAASLTCSDANKSRVLFVHSGNDSLRSRHYKNHFDESASTDIALKPDFFTAKVMQDKQSQTYKPDNLYVPSQSTPTPQDTKHPVQDEKSLLLQPLLLKSDKCFGFKDVTEINITKWLKNLQLKAAEVLRFQFHRQYVIGFLVAGVKIRVAVFSREGQFLGNPVYYTKGTELLACLVADLTASETEIGFLPERFLSYSNLTQHFTVPMLSICNKMIPFELLEQKIWPRKDCLLDRGTTVHRAKKPDSDKIYALKMSSPYSSRLHEGIAMHHLEKVSDAARIEAYADWPKSDFQKLLYSIEWNTPMPVTTFSRSFRLTATECVEKALYCSGPIAEQGILHRDLSFENVRLSRLRINDVDDLEVKLIDFDLFDEVDKIGQGEASANQTGTTLFMPIEILENSPTPSRHEQHEDETAFWVGALAIFHRYFRNNKVQSLCSDESTDSMKLALSKSNFLLTFINYHKSSWLDQPVKEFRVYLDLFRAICDKVIKVQFGNYVPGFQYPNLEEHNNGRRRQKEDHLRINPLICRILDNAIKTLRDNNIDLAGRFQQMCADDEADDA